MKQCRAEGRSGEQGREGGDRLGCGLGCPEGVARSSAVTAKECGGEIRGRVTLGIIVFCYYSLFCFEARSHIAQVVFELPVTSISPMLGLRHVPQRLVLCSAGVGQTKGFMSGR